MSRFITLFYAFAVGAGCTLLVFLALFGFAGPVFAHEPDDEGFTGNFGNLPPVAVFEKDPRYRIHPRPIEGYDNSDFLRDMDDIARGTYIEPYDPEDDRDGN